MKLASISLHLNPLENRMEFYVTAIFEDAEIASAEGNIADAKAECLADIREVYGDIESEITWAIVPA